MAKTSVDLFRSVTKEDFPDGTVLDGKPTPGVLFPDFVDRPLPSGTIRRADVHQFTDSNGHDWITSGGGTSLFDRPGVFPPKKWTSFRIPLGTVVPESIIVKFDGWRERFQANHYQIESATNTMRSDAFRGALENLARNAIVRSIQLASNH